MTEQEFNLSEKWIEINGLKAHYQDDVKEFIKRLKDWLNERENLGIQRYSTHTLLKEIDKLAGEELK